MLDKIQQFDSVLTEKQFDAVQAHLNCENWGLQYSDNTVTNKFFWILQNLEKYELFKTDILNTIQELTNKKFELIRAYINAQTILLDGAEHRDDHRENAYTFLIYINKEWMYEWGGETMFFDRYFDEKQNKVIENSKDYRLYVPIPNTALFFPSTIHHYGRAPARDFYGIRYTLAYKLLEI